MDTSEFLNAKKSFTWKSLIPMDFFMRSPSKAIEEIKNGEIKGRILVICKNLQEAKFCAFLLNAKTSRPFVCIDEVHHNPIPSEIDHLVMDFNSVDILRRNEHTPFDVCILWFHEYK